MGRDRIGELEHQTLLALLHLADQAHTAHIVAELEARTGTETALSSVYIVLRRLEEKGWVESAMVPPPDGAGRDRRVFRVTAEGLARLREARAAYLRLWDGIEDRLETGTP